MADLIDRQSAIDALTRKSTQLHGLHWGDHPEAPHIESGVLSSIEIIRELPSAQPETHDKRTETHACDLISRQAAIAIIRNRCKRLTTACVLAVTEIEQLQSAQPERDIPVKPIETTDKAWGIPKRQAVCPKCDYYLGHVAFLGDYKGKRVTYCETCGQAIDWEGWNFDE